MSWNKDLCNKCFREKHFRIKPKKKEIKKGKKTEKTETHKEVKSKKKPLSEIDKINIKSFVISGVVLFGLYFWFLKSLMIEVFHLSFPIRAGILIFLFFSNAGLLGLGFKLNRKLSQEKKK